MEHRSAAHDEAFDPCVGAFDATLAADKCFSPWAREDLPHHTKGCVCVINKNKNTGWCVKIIAALCASAVVVWTQSAATSRNNIVLL